MIYAFTGNLAFAEKAMSPVLLMPSNFAKNISKDSIKFTWQNAQNEVNAKVNAYRIIISENSQFNGYTTNTGRCNVTCVTSVINSTTFTTVLRSSNKTFYWRVQGLSSIENGEWSRTGTFKTDVPVPSITNASATPSPVTQGSTLTIAATLSGILPSNYSVKLNDNGNLSAMNGSGTSYSLSQSSSVIGVKNYSVGVYDINNNLKSSLFNGSYEVKKPNVAPTLNLINSSTTAITGSTYTVQLQGNDVDNNLSSIAIYWGDGTSNSQNTVSGSTLTFTHSYATANSYTWSATAYDSVNASSSDMTKTVSVSKANVVPTLSFISGNATATTGTTYTVQLQGNDADNNLSSMTINWGDGSSNSQNAASGSVLTFTHIFATANTFTWSATAYDSVNASSDNVAKTVTVSTPIVIPSISSASASPTATTVGNSINFSATLSSNLPSGYSVKLNYGNASVVMSGSGTNYSVVQTPTLLGQQVFTVGVYDANNNLKGNVFTSNFEIVKANSVPTLSFISVNTTATAGTSYSVQLQASDIDNNLKSITVVWGDGTTDTQNATNGTTVTFTHTYATANTYNWSATALDSGNASSTAIAKSVTVSAAVVTPPVSSSSYTKISNTGASLPDTAVLGSGPNDWACTKDNKTGLIWEVKTTDGGLRDMAKNYTNYFSGEVDYGKSTNSDYFVSTINKQTLCGDANWRVPSYEELKGLIFCSDGQYTTLGIDKSGYICTNNNLVTRPPINIIYFPNTQTDWYGTSSSVSGDIGGIWSIKFGGNDNSYAGGIGKVVNTFVRLVHDTQSSVKSYTKISNTGASLPDTALLGSGSNDWACTKDNKTGLIWEVKTTDGGLRDMKWRYSWYQPSGDNGGNAGYTDFSTPNCSTKNNCNTYAFTNAVNALGLCGKNDWRMPTKDELMKLVVCSDGNYQTDGSCTNPYSVARPTINSTYFPNTWMIEYWTSSPYAGNSSNAWGVGFYGGDSGYLRKVNPHFVRLVR